ncbi:4Fe-4S binding protein [Hungatella sp. L36]|nr:4Fe-4S binding protein [Hungatella sp. L36]
MGYKILAVCNQCGKCLSVCPSNCIEQGPPFQIREENCIHCGTCYKTCPYAAIKKL